MKPAVSLAATRIDAIGPLRPSPPPLRGFASNFLCSGSNFRRGRRIGPVGKSRRHTYLALPREVVGLLAAPVQRDEQVRAAVPVGDGDLGIAHLIASGLCGGGGVGVSRGSSRERELAGEHGNAIARRAAAIGRGGRVGLLGSSSKELPAMVAGRDRAAWGGRCGGLADGFLW